MKKEYTKATLEESMIKIEDIMLVSGTSDGDFGLPVKPQR